MTGEKHDYQAYLLRLWRVNTSRGAVWHASLEDSRTGERRGFADLVGLFTYLEEQTTLTDRPSVSHNEGYV